MEINRRRNGAQLGFTAALLAVVVVLTACADEPSTTTTPDSATELMSTLPSSTTTLTSATTSAVPTDLPGAPYVGEGPQAGDTVAAIGVAHDELLDLLAGPGDDYAVVVSLPPDTDGITATGRARIVDHTIWYETETDGETGWADASYLAIPGATDDATSQVVAAHGAIPAGDTMEALGLIVAESYAGDEGGTVTMTVAPAVGDLGETTYDVLGLDDDAIIGYRLHIFGQQDGGTGPFSLHSVERTLLCWRGVTDDGSCL